MRPFIFSRILRAVAPAIALAATMAAPAYAEDVTPQAADARAAFLAYPNTPAPPAPVKVCVVDTGVDLTTDVAGAVVERYSEFGGSVGDTGGGGIDKHGTFVAGVIASQLDGRGSVGIWPRRGSSRTGCSRTATAGRPWRRTFKRSIAAALRERRS